MRRSPFSAPVRSSSVPSGGYTATRLLSRSAGVISLEHQEWGQRKASQARLPCCRTQPCKLIDSHQERLRP